MSIKTQITVGNCAGCPFYERGATSVTADFLLKRPQKSGFCKHGGLGMPFPLGRRHIPDELKVPSDCPLRVGEATVLLESGK
jgi:hypothetical protein